MEKFKLIIDFMNTYNKINELKWYEFKKYKKLESDLKAVGNELRSLNIFEFISIFGNAINSLSAANNVKYTNPNIIINNKNISIITNDNVRIDFLNETAYIEETNFSYSVNKKTNTVPFIQKRWDVLLEDVYDICFTAIIDISVLI